MLCLCAGCWCLTCFIKLRLAAWNFKQSVCVCAKTFTHTHVHAHRTTGEQLTRNFQFVMHAAYLLNCCCVCNPACSLLETQSVACGFCAQFVFELSDGAPCACLCTWNGERGKNDKRCDVSKRNRSKLINVYRPSNEWKPSHKVSFMDGTGRTHIDKFNRLKASGFKQDPRSSSILSFGQRLIQLNGMLLLL